MEETQTQDKVQPIQIIEPENIIINQKMGNQEYKPVALISVATVALSILLLSFGFENKNQIATLVVSLDTSEKPSQFIAPEITAKAAVVYDVNKDMVIFGKNEQLQMPLASLTKIITAITTTETLAPDTETTISKEAISEEGDSGLIVGEKWRAGDLASFMLVNSSNDGARALALLLEEATGETATNLLNKFAAEKVGLTQSFFLNPTGLDTSETIGGSFGTPEDIAKLMAYASTRHPEIFFGTTKRQATYTSINGRRVVAQNTNPYVENTAGLVASKTGFTDLAGGNLSIAFDIAPTKRIIIVVMGSTADDRFFDVEKLVKATQNYFGSVELNTTY